MRELSGRMETVYVLIGVVVTQLYIFVKTDPIIHLRSNITI